MLSNSSLIDDNDSTMCGGHYLELHSYPFKLLLHLTPIANAMYSMYNFNSCIILHTHTNTYTHTIFHSSSSSSLGKNISCVHVHVITTYMCIYICTCSRSYYGNQELGRS